MKIKCKACQIELNISEDKIPQDKPLKMLCPRCNSQLDIPVKAASPEAGGGNCLPEQGWDPLTDYANAIDVVDEGVKTALLCDTDIKRGEKIVQALQDLDFWVVHANRPAFALNKLHHNHYDLVVLDENFHSEKDTQNLVLHRIQLFPMHLRRQFFFCLLSAEKPTMDAKLAFRIGVNLVLNINDLDKVKVLFARVLKDHRNFYSLFNSELVKKDGRIVK